jgi:predicted dehydrogenase
MVPQGLTGPPVVASLETHWNRGRITTPCRGAAHGPANPAARSWATPSTPMISCAAISVRSRSVQAQLATRVNPIETEDCAAIAMGFANGALATSSVTLGAARDETRLRFVFRDLTATSGTAPYAPAMDHWRFEARDPDRQAEVDGIVAAHADARGGFAGYLSAVADHLDGNAGAAVLFEDGRASVELVTAIYDAARSGRAVTLPLSQEHPLWRGWVPEVAP